MAYSKMCDKCNKMFKTIWENESLCDECKANQQPKKTYNNNQNHGNMRQNNNYSNNSHGLPQGHLISSYSVDGSIDKNLIGEKSKQLAEILSRDLNYTQIRGFYEECQGYMDLSFEDMMVNLALLKAKIAYAKGRGVISESFYGFMNNRIDNIRSEKDVKYFMMHFQAVLSYFKFYKPK